MSGNPVTTWLSNDTGTDSLWKTDWSITAVTFQLRNPVYSSAKRCQPGCSPPELDLVQIARKRTVPALKNLQPACIIWYLIVIVITDSTSIEPGNNMASMMLRLQSTLTCTSNNSFLYAVQTKHFEARISLVTIKKKDLTANYILPLCPLSCTKLVI